MPFSNPSPQFRPGYSLMNYGLSGKALSATNVNGAMRLLSATRQKEFI